MAKDERYVLVPLELWTKIFDLVQAQPLKDVISLHKEIEGAQLQVVDLSGQQQQQQQQPTAGTDKPAQKRGPKKKEQQQPAADPNKPKRGRKPKVHAITAPGLALDEDQEQEQEQEEFSELESEQQ